MMSLFADLQIRLRATMPRALTNLMVARAGESPRQWRASMDTADARARIADMEHIRAFISLTDEIGSGPSVAVKDNIAVRGSTTTAGSMVLPPNPASDDAPAIARIRQNGHCVVGKANLHEWACGVTSANPHYGTVLNPRDTRRIAGGSSGGSAAAVAAKMCDWSVATDTAGSIRVPASLCGVVGMRPSLGRVPTAGVFPLSTTLDTVGPIGPSVLAVAEGLAAMLASPRPVPKAAQPLSRWRVAIPEGWVRALDVTTQAAWDRVEHLFPRISFPDRDGMAEACSPVILREAAEYHSRYLPAQAYKYGADVLAYLRRGLSVTMGEYTDALDQHRRLKLDVAAAMADFDAVLVPTTATVAPLVGDTTALERLLEYTRPLSVTGQPVISIPIPSDGLPVGIQLVGHVGRDAELLEVARSWEEHFATGGPGQ